MQTIDDRLAVTDERTALQLPPPDGPPFAALEPPVGAERPSPRAGWERPALGALLVATAVLYLWGLGATGWANSFYSAAAQAGSVSWKAWFFGSSDAASSITVDKPPASLWVMGLSVRIFGLSSWSILVPQALMGVATVGVVFAAVRRWFTARAAFIAGVALALTPVAALMFRFNNPDAMLTLLMALGAYTLLRGVEDGRLRWIVATGAIVGFGFLTKQLQVLLVVPGFALAYLIAAPRSFGRRIVHLLAGGAAMIAAAGWWLAIVELWPASMRPYIGGSQHNSILELTLGYNGFGRLTGDETGSVGGGGGGGNGGMWGATGITRMFDGVMGGQIAWLLPAALALLVIGLWLTRRAARTDLARASLVVWGSWMVVTALVFSYMQGIFHEYYAVALAPAMAALVGIGAEMLWSRRSQLWASVTMALIVLGTAWWSAALLDRAPDWNPWLRPLVLGGGVAVAVALLAGRALPKVAVGAGLAALAVCLAGPAAWALQTAATSHQGSIVTAGPAVVGGRTGGPGGGGFPTGPGGGQLPGGQLPGGQLPGGGFPTPPGAGQTPGGGFPGGAQLPGGGAVAGGQGGGAGGLLDSAEVSDEVAALLSEDADQYTWAAAAVGSNRASGFQLATELPVMPIGGFNGSDPSPTLEQFQEDVANGEIHWFIAGGGFGQSMGGSGEASSIATWVASTFDSVTVDGVTLYDLTT